MRSSPSQKYMGEKKMACPLLRGQILIRVKITLVGVKNTLVGVKNTLSRGQILLGIRNTLSGGQKYFS